MQLMRHFWDAARALDPRARELDEGVRFRLCAPEPLHILFTAAGLADVQVRPIDVPTRFRDFDDYWTPFLGGQAPAPGYGPTDVSVGSFSRSSGEWRAEAAAGEVGHGDQCFGAVVAVGAAGEQP